MIGTGDFNGICVPKSQDGGGETPDNCEFINSGDLTVPIGSLQFPAGTWQRLPYVTALGSHALRVSGDSPLAVVRPSARTRGISGSIIWQGHAGDILRIYNDLVATPGPTYVEMKLGDSGYIKAVSTRGSETTSFAPGTFRPDLDTGRLTGVLIFFVCKWLGNNQWYLWGTNSGSTPTGVQGITTIIPCDEPRYGRVAFGFPTLGDAAYVLGYGFGGIGKTVNAAGDESTERFDTCICSDCMPPQCIPCRATSIDVTLSGADPIACHDGSTRDINGSYTLTGQQEAIGCEWSHLITLDSCAAIGPILIAMPLSVAWGADGSARISLIGGAFVDLPAETVDDPCTRLIGVELPFGGGTLAIDSVSS